MARNTTTRDRLRRQIARGKPDCHICGDPIDYGLPHLDPGAYVIDHVIPLAKGGANDIDNVAAAHNSCNRAKSDSLPGDLEPTARTFITTRTW